MHQICDCEACKESEKLQKNYYKPYKYHRSYEHNFIIVFLWLFTFVFGVILLYPSNWMYLSALGFILAFIVNSFMFCSKCPYKHSNTNCGCYIMSPFPIKIKKKWSNFEQILGWPIIFFLFLSPVVYYLIQQGEVVKLLLYLGWSLIIFFLIIHSIMACPQCRQRHICFKGRIVIYFRKEVNS
ncbi:MAG: hypothetical protein ACE5WD_06520 [Candidatus Aminicenantia bacterium]